MMTLHAYLRISRSAALCLALVSVPRLTEAQEEVAPGVETPPPDSYRDKAMAHYTNGRDLLELQNFQDAFPQLLLAYDLAERAESPNAWKILGSLGYCALQLERDGEALEFYRSYLERGGDEIPQEERESIERELVLIEGNLVTVEVSMGEEKFRVIVSRAGSLAPPQAYDSETGALKLGLRAGTHVFAVEKGDRALAEKRTTVQPGESRVIEFEEPKSEPKAESSPPPPVPPETVPPPEEKKSRVRPLRIASFVAGGFGIAGLLTGAVFAARSGAERDDARDAVTSDPDLCRDDVCLPEAEGRFEKADSLATTRSVFLVGGGALLATGVGLFLYDLRKKNSESALRVVPSVGAGSGSLHLFGSF